MLDAEPAPGPDSGRWGPEVPVTGAWALLRFAPFLAGFCLFFVLGATASTLGGLLLGQLPLLEGVSGGFIILLGVIMLSRLRIKLPGSNACVNAARLRSGPFGAFGMGFAIAITWTPCTGPTLGGAGSTASAAPTGDADRETAETRLRTIGTQLAKVLADYRSGSKQRAYTLAKSISTNLYEGTTEGIVSTMDPAGERQTTRCSPRHCPQPSRTVNPQARSPAPIAAGRCRCTCRFAAGSRWCCFRQGRRGHVPDFRLSRELPDRGR